MFNPLNWLKKNSIKEEMTQVKITALDVKGQPGYRHFIEPEIEIMGDFFFIDYIDKNGKSQTKMFRNEDIVGSFTFYQDSDKLNALKLQ